LTSWKAFPVAFINLAGFSIVESFDADTFLGLDKDMNGTLSKEELQAYADGTLTEIFIERGMFYRCKPLQLICFFKTVSQSCQYTLLEN